MSKSHKMVMPKISNDVLAERIDNLSKQVAGIDDKLENLRMSFSPRSELQALENRVCPRIDKLEVTVYGPNKDGKGGGAEKIIMLGDSLEEQNKAISKIWTVVGLLITLFISYGGWILWLLIEHIKDGK